MKVGDYDIDIVVQGFPGKSVCHGGLGWSTVVLLRAYARTALIDAGSFGMSTRARSACVPCSSSG